MFIGKILKNIEETFVREEKNPVEVPDLKSDGPVKMPEVT